MNYQQALSVLSSIDQSHILNHWKLLSTKQRSSLLNQISNLDLKVLRNQKELIFDSHKDTHYVEPIQDVSFSGNISDKNFGKQLIAQGLMGCLIVAGGQGTRLNFDKPKGLFPITLFKKKSLFQFLAEKVLAASEEVSRLLPIAIMTSSFNFEITVKFFEENAYFGLQKEQISFFCQTNLPFMDNNGKIFLDSPDHIAEGPDGNGDALRSFYRSGLWGKWALKGVRYLNFILIDNALADPFDAELVGFQSRQNSEIVIKCTTRDNPEEKVGIIIKEKNATSILEYSEIPENERLATKNGALKYRYANLSLFCFDMNFILRKSSSDTPPLPLHKAYKHVNYLDSNRLDGEVKKKKAWKFEKFIFDLLQHTKKVNVLVYPRETCFAPLKNLSGPDSLTTVQEALLKNDLNILMSITKNSCSDSTIELSPRFYYPTAELLKKWQGKALRKKAYIDP